MMDQAMIPMLIERLGGGLAAIVIIGLAYAVATLYRRNNQLQDKMLEMAMTLGKENRDLLAVTNATVSASTQAITEMIRRMEASR